MLPWYNQLLSLKHASWNGVLSLHIGQTFIALKQWYRRMLYFHIIYTSIQVNTVKSKGKTLQEVQEVIHLYIACVMQHVLYIMQTFLIC